MKITRYLPIALLTVLLAACNVDNTAFGLHVDRANIFRAVHAEAAALNHRRATHANIAIFGGDGYIGTAKEYSIASKATAIINGNTRGYAARFGIGCEAHNIQ